MKNYRDPLLAALGVLLVLAGLWQVRAGGSVLGYVCIGLGCSATAQGSWWPAGRCEMTPPCKRNRRSSAGMNGTWPLHTMPRAVRSI